MTEIALPKPSPWLLRGRTEVARHRKRFDQLSPRRIVARKIDEWMDGVIKDPNLEFSGISHIRFSMGVSAKLAALHTDERGLIAQVSCSHAALPSKRGSARERVRLGQRLYRERLSPELQSLIPAGDLMVVVIASRSSA
jgi:hypothetical protein